MVWGGEKSSRCTKLLLCVGPGKDRTTRVYSTALSYISARDWNFNIWSHHEKSIICSTLNKMCHSLAPRLQLNFVMFLITQSFTFSFNPISPTKQNPQNTPTPPHPHYNQTTTPSFSYGPKRLNLWHNPRSKTQTQKISFSPTIPTTTKQLNTKRKKKGYLFSCGPKRLKLYHTPHPKNSKTRKISTQN